MEKGGQINLQENFYVHKQQHKQTKKKKTKTKQNKTKQNKNINNSDNNRES